MKTLRSLLAALVLLASSALVARAQAVNPVGTWYAEFDTQIGAQKYRYTLARDGAALTGRASSEVNGVKRDGALQNVKLTADTLTFTEIGDYQGNALTITYIGIITGDEINFARKVMEFANEDFVARREKPSSK